MEAVTKKIGWAQLQQYWYIYLLPLPSLLLVATFAYYPAVSGMYHAFFRWNGDFIKQFIGLANFAEAVRDPVLGHGFMVIFVLVLANGLKMVPSITTAVVINRLISNRSSYFYKVLFVIPMIIPMMVRLLMWKFFYDPSNGVLNAVLESTGLMKLLYWLDGIFSWGIFVPGSNPVWLGEEKLIIPSLILWGFPWIGTVGVLIYLSGLQSIDHSVYEAGALDGVGPFQKFFYIEFPLILAQVRINLVLMIINTLKEYGRILVLFGTEGGPNGVAMVPGLYMYTNAFVKHRAGYACAIGIILFSFILLLTEINNRFVRIKD